MPDEAQSPTTTPGIFLSYASEDAPAARSLAEALRACGLNVWFDQNELRGGDAWDQRIRRQIKECSLFVPIISEQTQRRAEGYFRLEWHLAEQRSFLMAHDKPFIVPVVLDSTPDAQARVPDRFRERQWTRIVNGTMPEAFPALLKELLGLTPEASARPAPLPTAGAPTSSDNSIAVLAFANLSGDKDNEYFSDGVSDELLTLLQSIKGLRVAARTSSFTFKGKTATAQEIGAKLGVANLVEGSVQKSGNRIKLSARLSRTDSGEMTWSRSYTRELNDVFALQEELAVAIVGEVKGLLSAERKETEEAVHEAAQRGGTRNLQAYEHYLLGRHLSYQFSAPDTLKAIECLNAAVALDPSFALAWANLSNAHSWVCGYSGAMNREAFNKHLSLAREAAERALALAPDLPAALGAKIWILFGYDFKWREADLLLQRALTLAPEDTTILLRASMLAQVNGDSEAAVAYARKVVASDPMNPRLVIQLGMALLMAGRYEEGRAQVRRFAEINPRAIFATAGIGFSYLNEGRWKEAEDSVAGIADPDWPVLWVRNIAAFKLGKSTEAQANLEALIRDHADTAAIQIAACFALASKKDEAFAWLRRAREQSDPGLCTMGRLFLFDSLKADPRWVDFWSAMGVDASDGKMRWQKDV